MASVLKAVSVTWDGASVQSTVQLPTGDREQSSFHLLKASQGFLTALRVISDLALYLKYKKNLTRCHLLDIASIFCEHCEPMEIFIFHKDFILKFP